MGLHAADPRGHEVYDVKYETVLDYLSTALVKGASVDARLHHGRMYLETPTAELEGSIIGKHQANSDTLAHLPR
jgi:hypothetical protein